MKKFVIFILLMSMILTTVNLNTHAASDNITVKVNGKLIEFDVQPFINEDNRTLVPIRFIAQNLGAEVSWNQELKEVTITKQDTVIKLIIGEKKATVNDEVKEFDTKAVVIDGRTLVPVRFISQTLGSVVDWDGETRTVLVKKYNEIKEVEATEIIIDGEKVTSDNPDGVIKHALKGREVLSKGKGLLTEDVSNGRTIKFWYYTNKDVNLNDFDEKYSPQMRYHIRIKYDNTDGSKYPYKLIFDELPKNEEILSFTKEILKDLYENDYEEVYTYFKKKIDKKKNDISYELFEIKKFGKRALRITTAKGNETIEFGIGVEK